MTNEEKRQIIMVNAAKRTRSPMCAALLYNLILDNGETIRVVEYEGDLSWFKPLSKQICKNLHISKPIYFDMLNTLAKHDLISKTIKDNRLIVKINFYELNKLLVEDATIDHERTDSIQEDIKVEKLQEIPN